jgi:hypothetical protein
VKNAHTISVGKRSSEKTTWEDVDIKLKWMWKKLFVR